MTAPKEEPTDMLEGMGKETGDLIARLNAPSNWLRQYHGHWKGALHEYDLAPFEAAAALAAKDAEIARLQMALDGCECANCVSARNAIRGPGDAALAAKGK